jgi:membrane protease YdiL (CAAX protease family)
MHPPVAPPALRPPTDGSSTKTPAHPWVRRHQFLTFVAIAYAFSWTLWGLAAIGVGRVPFLVGGLGPMVAAAAVITLTGRSLRDWIRPVWRWRVPARWWAYALGLPALLYAIISLVLQVTGSPVDWSLALGRLPAYAGTFIFVLFVGGGLEEPGWRGFGLPLLQQQLSPLKATLLLGLVWGVWHVPLYGPAGFVVPMVLAFFYTVLWNRTRSVGLCILLHASFTPAQDQLILMTRDKVYTDVLDAPDWAILGVYTVAVLLLIALTRGRLGEPATPVASASQPPVTRQGWKRMNRLPLMTPTPEAERPTATGITLRSDPGPRS